MTRSQSKKTKPIQSQSKPIAERVQLMQCVYLQRIMKKNADRSYEKTKPNKANLRKATVLDENIGQLSSVMVKCAIISWGLAIVCKSL